jgi:hypothetical protein
VKADTQPHHNDSRQNRKFRDDLRFIVDVISHFAGINGVFAETRQKSGNEGLKQLWLSEGDLGKLLQPRLLFRKPAST